MSSRLYIIPTDSMTLSDQKNYRLGAIAAAIQRAYSQGVATWDVKDVPVGADPNTPSIPDFEALKRFLEAGGWPKNLDLREFQPTLDAGAGAAVDFWNTAALAAVGTEYSCLGAVAVAPAAARAKKIVVWYKAQVQTTPLPVNRLLFRRNVATGLLQAEFDLEQLACQERVDGYFSEPVVWDNNTAYAVNAMCMLLTGVAAKVILGNVLIEPAGITNV